MPQTFFKFDKFNKGWAVMTSFKNDIGLKGE